MKAKIDPTLSAEPSAAVRSESMKRATDATTASKSTQSAIAITAPIATTASKSTQNAITTTAAKATDSTFPTTVTTASISITNTTFTTQSTTVPEITTITTSTISSKSTEIAFNNTNSFPCNGKLSFDSNICIEDENNPASGPFPNYIWYILMASVVFFVTCAICFWICCRAFRRRGSKNYSLVELKKATQFVDQLSNTPPATPQDENLYAASLTCAANIHSTLMLLPGIYESSTALKEARILQQPDLKFVEAKEDVEVAELNHSMENEYPIYEEIPTNETMKKNENDEDLLGN